MAKLLDGEQEAQLTALRLGPPPGNGSWSLRLLARQVVELGIVASISHETRRRGHRVTSEEFRTALCFHRTYARVLHPSLSVLSDHGGQPMQQPVRHPDRGIERSSEGQPTAA